MFAFRIAGPEAGRRARCARRAPVRKPVGSALCWRFAAAPSKRRSGRVVPL